MKMILKIAKKEWMQLFFSPIAWLLLVAFIVQTSLIFIHRYMSMVDASAYHSGYSAMTQYSRGEITEFPKKETTETTKTE